MSLEPRSTRKYAASPAGEERLGQGGLARSALVALLVCGSAGAIADPSQAPITDFGFNLGIGIEQYRQPYVEQASTFGEQQRIVFVEKQFRTVPSAWLTMNWNLMEAPAVFRAEGSPSTMKLGLFAGVKVLDSNSQTFSGFALGPQISFLAGERQISVGAGWVTHRTRTLLGGITDGQPLPPQFTEVRYREGSENSYMVMFAVKL